MNRKKRYPAIVYLAIISLITILVWISFEAFRALSTTPKSEVSPETLEPISPTLDEEALNDLQSSIFLNESEIADTQLTLPSLPTEGDDELAEETTQESAEETIEEFLNEITEESEEPIRVEDL